MSRNSLNMAEGPIWRHLLRFAVPVMFGSLLQQCYNIVDTMMVGRALGVDALAAVGATSNITFFFFSLLTGVTMGVSIIISQYFGAKDIKMLRRAYATSIYAMLGVVAVVTALGLLLRRPLLRLLSTPESVFEMADSYLVVIIIGLCTSALYNWISSILRAMGNSLTPLMFLAVSAVLNIFFNYLFIVVCGMGVRGAALGTVAAQLLSGVSCLIYALKTTQELRITREEFCWDGRLFKEICRYGIPAGIQTSFIAISIMAMQSVVNIYGAVVTAAYSVGTRVESFSMLVGSAIGMGVGTFTGQNVGAGKPERVKRGFWVAALMELCVCFVLSTLLLLFGPQVVGIFVDDPTAPEAAEMIRIGGTYVSRFAPCLLCVGVLNCLQNLLRASGDIAMTMAMGGWEIVTRVVVSFLLSSLVGMDGVWWATPITWTTTMLWGLARFLSGRWQNRGVRHTVAAKEAA